MGHNRETMLVLLKGLVKILENANVTIVRIETTDMSRIGFQPVGELK